MSETLAEPEVIEVELTLAQELVLAPVVRRASAMRQGVVCFTAGPREGGKRWVVQAVAVPGAKMEKVRKLLLAP